MTTERAIRDEPILHLRAEGRRLTKEPSRRTAVLATLLALAIAATGLAGRAAGARPDAGDDRGATAGSGQPLEGEDGTDTTAALASTTTSTIVSTSTPSPVDPTIPPTIVVESTTGSTIDAAPSEGSTRTTANGPMLAATIGECQEPGFVAGRVAVVPAACAPFWSQAMPVTDDLVLVVLRPDTVAEPLAGEVNTEPTLTWTSDRAVIGPPAVPPGGHGSDHQASIGWLLCGALRCTVTADPDLLIPLAVGRLAAEAPATGLDPAGCAPAVRDLIIALDPGAVGIDLRCGRAPEPTTTLGQDGCVLDSPPATPTEASPDINRLRLLQIGTGDGATFQPMATLPAPTDLCLDVAYDRDSLRFRYWTVLTSDRAVPGLMTTVRTSSVLPGAEADVPGFDPGETDPETTADTAPDGVGTGSATGQTPNGTGTPEPAPNPGPSPNPNPRRVLR